MKTSKLIALILAMLMTLTLAACDGGGTNPPGGGNTNPPANTTPGGGDSGTQQTPDNGDGEQQEALLPLKLPGGFEAHPGDEEYFYAITDNYVAYRCAMGFMPPAPGVLEPQTVTIENSRMHYHIFFFDAKDLLLVDPAPDEGYVPGCAVLSKIVYYKPVTVEYNDFHSAFWSDPAAYIDGFVTDRVEYGLHNGTGSLTIDGVCCELSGIPGETTKAEFVNKLESRNFHADGTNYIEGTYGMYISKPLN